MLNKVFLIGRLVRNNELRATQNGTPVLNNVIAFDIFENSEKKSCYFKIVAFGKIAEHIAKYTDKGTLIEIEGRLSQRNYMKGDEKQIITEITLTDCTFLDSSKNAKKIESSQEELEMEDLPF